jgi:hypothetical protein
MVNHLSKGGLVRLVEGAGEVRQAGSGACPAATTAGPTPKSIASTCSCPGRGATPPELARLAAAPACLASAHIGPVRQVTKPVACHEFVRDQDGSSNGRIRRSAGSHRCRRRRDATNLRGSIVEIIIRVAGIVG